MSLLLNRKSYENELRQNTANLFRAPERQEQFINEVCEFLFGSSQNIFGYSGNIEKIEDLEEMISKHPELMGSWWDELSNQAKCAACVAGAATLAAAIFALVVSSGGVATIALMELIVVKFGVGEAVAAAAAGGASAGAIAVLLCPPCKK
jgi:hypothetical protein